MTSSVLTEAAVVVVALRGLDRFRGSGQSNILRVQDCGRSKWDYQGGRVYRIPTANSIGQDGKPLFLQDDSQ